MSIFSFLSPLYSEPQKVILSGSHPGSGGHCVHYRVVGNNSGKPVLFLHGGPGRGIDASIWGFFNPRKYRIILVDQRGCGASTPRGCLENNNTQAVIEDLESIRVLLGVDKWMLFGCGSGSFFALAYAQKYPTRVSEIVINNIMTFRQKEIDWLFNFGASEHCPEAWEQFIRPMRSVPTSIFQRYYRLIAGEGNSTDDQRFSRPAEHGALLKRYYRMLTRGTPDEQRVAVQAWTLWEKAISGDTKFGAQIPDYDQALVVAKIACHYFLHHGFLSCDTQLLDHMDVIRKHKIPGVIVQGEIDRVNPIAHARDLCLAWPEARFVVVPGAGHSTRDPGIQKALVAATEDFAGCGCLFQFGKKEESGTPA